MVRMVIEDTWYIPCEVTLQDALNLNLYLRKHRKSGGYFVSLYEGEFFFDDERMIVRVVERRGIKGNTHEQKERSKMERDEDVIYILKCAKLLGYKFILESKYSN